MTSESSQTSRTLNHPSEVCYYNSAPEFPLISEISSSSTPKEHYSDLPPEK
jgi:hypothetical protein